LTHRVKGLRPEPHLEAAWTAFYDFYSHKIRTYAFTCGATEENIADCAQDVWAELLVRLPEFRLDPCRGRFDTWLFHIVRGKTVNSHRSDKRRPLQQQADTLQTVIDVHPTPARTLEDCETFELAWEHLKQCLSDCNFQILHMRLMEQRSVAEVAAALGL